MIRKKALSRSKLFLSLILEDKCIFALWMCSIRGQFFEAIDVLRLGDLD